MRRRDGLRRLQPQSRPVGRPLERTTPVRPVLVPTVRDDVRARRPGDDPRQSASCNEHFHATGSHYLGADTTAFMQALTLGLLTRLPDHALDHPARGRSGAVPLGPLQGHGRGHTGWDCSTACWRTSSSTPASTTSAGIDLLVDVVPTDNILFASEMVGAVRGHRPRHRQLLRRHEDATSTRVLARRAAKHSLRAQRPSRVSPTRRRSWRIDEESHCPQPSRRRPHRSSARR